MRENTVVAIVDFDNVMGYHSDLNNTNKLTTTINNLITKSIHNDKVDYCLIRLYGGWHSNEILTNRASEILQTLGRHDFFPIVKDFKIIHGEIELASSMYHIGNLIWGDTYIRRNGVPSIKLDSETLDIHCNQENVNCPARLLRKFTKRKNKQCHITDCTVINSKAFIVSEQKMVDTIMAIDIIDYSREKKVSHLLVFSDDIDLIPPVIRAHIDDNNKVKLYLFNKRLAEKFTHLKEVYGLKIDLIE